MGSGCNPSSSSFGSVMRPTPDSSIIYTGAPIAALGICTGDTLAEVDATILQKIVSLSQGNGISLSDIDLTQCACFTQQTGDCGNIPCTTLTCILQAYLDCLCSMYTDLQTVKTDMDSINGPYNVKCLSGVTSNSTFSAIMQELITEYCNLVTTVAGIETQLDGLNVSGSVGNFLQTALTSCTGTGNLIKSGTGASFTAAFKGFVPVGAVVPYAGLTAGKFDSTGLGLTGTDMCGWALANGLNGTVDMRELVPVGVGAGAMGGGTLPSVADGSNYSLNQLFGEAKHILTVDELPSTASPINISDPGHSHGIRAEFTGKSGINEAAWVIKQDIGATGNPPPTEPFQVFSGTNYIQNSFTGISASISFGKGIGHETRQPSRALYYIQRIN